MVTEQDPNQLRNEMATTSEAPAVVEYNITGDGDTDGMKRVVLPVDDTAAVSVPHVAEVPKPKQMPIPSDREQEVKVSKYPHKRFLRSTLLPDGDTSGQTPSFVDNDSSTSTV